MTDHRKRYDGTFKAKVLIENWRREYNTIRPHSSLGYKPPAPETRAPYLQNFLAEAKKKEEV
jgi:putative transposase